MTKIEAAVEHLRGPAQDRAEQFARETIQRVYDELAASDWDAYEVAPYPSGCRGTRSEYFTAKSRADLFRQLTQNDDERNPYCCRGWRDPEYVVANPEAAERFVSDARSDAAAQYDAFIAKLEGKIGAVTEASLTGEHVWGYSFLTVVTEDGERQTWKTRMILNVSRLGKVFNQWPTRKVKN